MEAPMKSHLVNASQEVCMWNWFQTQPEKGVCKNEEALFFNVLKTLKDNKLQIADKLFYIVSC